jgi:hypothetical protein
MSAACERLASGRLWSLWEIMVKFDVRVLIVRLGHVERFEKELRGHMRVLDGALEPQMMGFGRPMWTSDDPNALATQDGQGWIIATIGPMVDEISR